ncbi:MAG: lipoate--protein ligase family protein [Oscillatoriales cyanobacterium RM2_1_1]|nr:lipoate--protein ligase family protein [Oscillatoriales cyanobacterium SM2_3_0]NJO47066.1 lipoate--protein ligase family protein [Oscillatoriales cyanobacterium RM2_1_1]
MFSQPCWRLIPPFRADGFLQMAIDRWLLEQYHSGRSLPVLRFYTWEPVALSLGHHQRQWPEEWNHLIWRGQPVELVRRPTGGRGVLHQGDLTYTAIAPSLSGDRLTTYKAICRFLIEGWRSLGIALTYGSRGREYRHQANCFRLATGADLVMPQGEKLIGSAQFRRDRAVLQQGSIRLNPDPALYSQVFGEELILPASLNALVSQADFLPHLIEVLIEAARRCFATEFQVEPLSEIELQALQALQRETP